MNFPQPLSPETPSGYYQSLVHSMNDGFCIIELVADEQDRPQDFRFVETNLAFEKQSGLHNVAGRLLRGLMPDVAAHWVDAYARVVMTGEPLVLDNQLGPRRGRFDVSAARIGGPGSHRVGVVFRNVTEQQASAHALRRTEERYRKLFESIDEGFCVMRVLFDRSGRAADYRFLEVNASFERQTGLKGAQGRRMRDLAPGHEEHWFETYGRVATTGEPIRFQNEAKALGRWYDVYAFRIAEPDEVAVLFNDITGRIREDERQRQESRRKDEFLAMLAHELRNPLAPISSAAELLERGASDEARVRRASEIIRRQVRHMTGLVDDLLDVSRVTRGLVTLERGVVDLKRVLSEAVEQVRPLIESRGHALTTCLPPEAIDVQGDPTRLVQVFTNLLNNAAKYTSPGGRIDIAMRKSGGDVEVVVSDNGMGLAPDFLSSAFELFTQAERSSDRAQGGLGIGLALVRSLVQLHGGQVSAASEGMGRGSSFTVRLPALAGAHAAAQDAPGHGEPPSHGLTVMVVDDNVDAAETMAMLVETMGHRAIVEHGSRRALKRALSEPPDLFLLDVGLPDIDGHELARQLRQMPATAGAVMAAVTGYGQEQDRVAALEAGFDRHFVKPVDPARLQELFDEVAARR